MYLHAKGASINSEHNSLGRILWAVAHLVWVSMIVRHGDGVLFARFSETLYASPYGHRTKTDTEEHFDELRRQGIRDNDAHQGHEPCQGPRHAPCLNT
jgi:hypothetical protein